MNDFSEIEYGHQRLLAYISIPERRNRFFEALEGLGANTAQEVFDNYEHWLNDMRFGTYIACFSGHSDGQENNHGRLSMWRGYGNKTSSVALIFRPPAPDSANKLHVFMEPVLYDAQSVPVGNGAAKPESKLEQEIDLVIANIVANKAHLAGHERDYLLHLLHLPLMFSAITVKHPAFDEEREWRLILRTISFSLQACFGIHSDNRWSSATDTKGQT